MQKIKVEQIIEISDAIIPEYFNFPKEYDLDMILILYEESKVRNIKISSSRLKKLSSYASDSGYKDLDSALLEFYKTETYNEYKNIKSNLALEKSTNLEPDGTNNFENVSNKYLSLAGISLKSVAKAIVILTICNIVVWLCLINSTNPDIITLLYILLAFLIVVGFIYTVIKLYSTGNFLIEASKETKSRE